MSSPSRNRPWTPALLVLGVVGLRYLLRSPARAAQAKLGKQSRDIIEGASEAIISTDASDTIVRANPSAADMFGTTVREMRGSALSRYLTSAAPRAGSGLPNGRRATDFPLTGVKVTGEEFPLEGSISSAWEHDGPIQTMILRDITERKLVQESLARSHAQLRQLSAALQTIREEERTHIARELHDDPGQLLASLRIDLGLLQKEPANSPAALKLMQGMDERLLAAITSLRRIASNLRPRALDEGGLYFALQALRQDFTARHGIALELFADEAELRLDDVYSTAIYRIVQEALTNIARHAQAKRVLLNLFKVDSEMLITIRDDGIGIAPSDMEKPASLGLVGMRERVWAIKGSIAITGDDPRGTRIDIVLPLPSHD